MCILLLNDCKLNVILLFTHGFKRINMSEDFLPSGETLGEIFCIVFALAFERMCGGPYFERYKEKCTFEVNYK